jgi:hypothetical protein
MVGATIRRFQGKTVSVLTEKDVSAGMEVLVDKGSWTGVACSWNRWKVPTRWILERQDRLMWTALIRRRIGTSGRLL